jgi:hypothetical protein
MVGPTPPCRTHLAVRARYCRRHAIDIVISEATHAWALLPRLLRGLPVDSGANRPHSGQGQERLDYDKVLMARRDERGSQIPIVESLGDPEAFRVEPQARGAGTCRDTGSRRCRRSLMRSELDSRYCLACGPFTPRLPRAHSAPDRTAPRRVTSVVGVAPRPGDPESRSNGPRQPVGQSALGEPNRHHPDGKRIVRHGMTHPSTPPRELGDGHAGNGPPTLSIAVHAPAREPTSLISL